MVFRTAVTYCISAVMLATVSGGGEDAVESDNRLHSDGSPWGVHRAERTDDNRPRILLIGDSILSGYRAQVVSAFADKAYVDLWINPHYQSEDLNRRLADVLRGNPYDVVHFNMGLHGWTEGRIDADQFEPLTEAYVKVLQRELPRAKLIWASSTPVTAADGSAALNAAINPIIVDHNRKAVNVMKRLGVPVNDLYSILVDKLELARGDQFHWKGEAYSLLADQVIRVIEEQLVELGKD
jgi:lysophospholipase L1-like esterase